MNVKNVYDVNFAIITEDDLKNNLGYVRSEDITDELMTSALVCATVRVDALSAGKVLTDFDNLSVEAKQKVKMAASFLAQYYLSGGYTWLRGSTSVSAGQINISQSLPDEPDYIQTWVYQLLQITDENLFKPTVSFKKEFGTETYNNTWNDYGAFTPLSWEQALAMFVKAWNIISTDKTVNVKVVFNNDREPMTDLSVNVPEINKYKDDNSTTHIDQNNVISATGIQDENHFYSPTTIHNKLLDKASVEDLSTKANQNFDNCDLKNLIAVRPDNKIIIDTDSQKLLVVESGGGKGYLPDGSTIKLNSDQTTLSAIAVKTGDNKIITAENISDIRANYVNKYALNQIVSTDAGNVLKVDSKDRKLYVAQGQGSTYKADEKTVHLDNTNNTFSTLGLFTNNEDKPVIGGEDIYSYIDESSLQIKLLKDDLIADEKTIENNTSSILSNKQAIESNKNAIKANTSSISTNTKAIEVNKNTINATDDIVNNKCVKNDELDSIVVDKKDKPDNILEVVDNTSLYVPASNQKWKLFAKPDDWTKVSDTTYDLKKPLNVGSAYNIVFKFDADRPRITKMFFCDVSVASSDNRIYIFQPSDKGLEKPSVLITWITGITSIISNFSEVSDIYMWELENAFEIPKVIIPVKPILTKKNVYNANKKLWCKEDFDD